MLGALPGPSQDSLRSTADRGTEFWLFLPSLKVTRTTIAMSSVFHRYKILNHTSFSIRAPVPLILSNQLDRFQPDIVHSHHPFMLGGTALVISEKYSIPLVFTYHTMYEEYTHYVPGNIRNLKSFVTQLALGYANQCNHVIFPSESVQSIIKKPWPQTTLVCDSDGC